MNRKVKQKVQFFIFQIFKLNEGVKLIKEIQNFVFHY